MAIGANVGYVRVSTTDQGTDRQLAGIELDRIFEEKQSGAAAANRKVLQECLGFLREGDTLHVHSIDRLARNLMDLQKTVEDLTERGVTVRFHKESLTFEPGGTNPMNTMLFQVLGAFAQFERALIRERQAEGIAQAKAAGKHLGRPSALSARQVAEIAELRADGQSLSKIAERYGVTRQTIAATLKRTQEAEAA
ncbi:recombinase family protein [Thiohalocapsa marina]|uniref:recombinase family protein n=1 Tax=Thiohalocapsa marina TaxID=424902 RepID=UPI0036DF177E